MLAKLRSLPPEEQGKILSALGPRVSQEMAHDWEFWARPEQIIPEGDWSYWVILAGRGFGKTRTGAETTRVWSRTNRYVNIIGATSDDAKDIMVEGESGILAVCPPDERPYYKKHERKLLWPNGAVTLIFTADEPERLRGKQHMKLWADEMAAWRYPEAWDQAKFGLRLGKRPQAVVTTTPRPTKTLRQLINDEHSFVTKGSTYDNKDNLAENFFTEIITRYEGTRLGRQELNAEMLDDTPGALWRKEILDEHRVPRGEAPTLRRIVVAVDPAVSNEESSDETGIVVAATDEKNHGYVLEDASGRYDPDGWAKRVASMYHKYEADCVVAEKNQGGQMVEHVIRSKLPNARVNLVSASRGKVTRAEPTSAMYEQGRISHVGRFDELEDQMVAFTSDFDRKSQGYSPDRVDALVWAFTELFPQIVKRAKSRGPKRQPKARFF